MPSKSKPKKRAPGKARRASVDPAPDQKRTLRREARRERSREEILAAARRVLLRDGVAATTLDAVAREVGLTKAALYYYYPSKDALLFELVFQTLEGSAQAVHDAVEHAESGGAALRAIIRETIAGFAPRMDDFRITYLHGQVVGGGTALRASSEQLTRVRPLNDLMFRGAAEKLAREWKKNAGRARVEPRLMAFLAQLAALGVLTMKGLVEKNDDPLLYSDDQLIDALARIFEAAAQP